MTRKPGDPIKLGILLSGGGTTFLNLHQRIQTGSLRAEITGVFSSRAKAAGLARAMDLGYPCLHFKRSAFPDDEAYSAAIREFFQNLGAELLVLAGFLRRFLPGDAYNQRCINIHPALLPAFGGKGFYGHHVHEAVWRHSCKISGCTVHMVNERYDEGAILVQEAVPISHEDQPEDIRRKVFELECEALPRAIAYFVEDRVRIEQGRSIILPPSRPGGS